MSFDRAMGLARGDEWHQLVDLVLGRTLLPPAPDAGATMMGAYGLANPTITWLLARFPFLLELTPRQLVEGLNQPTCRDAYCRRAMYLDLRSESGREVLYWHCPAHPAKAERVRLPAARAFVEPKTSLRRLIAETAAGKTLDWAPDEQGVFHVVLTE